MQNLLLIISINDVEAVFIKGKRFYQQNVSTQQKVSFNQ